MPRSQCMTLQITVIRHGILELRTVSSSVKYCMREQKIMVWYTNVNFITVATILCH